MIFYSKYYAGARYMYDYIHSSLYSVRIRSFLSEKTGLNKLIPSKTQKFPKSLCISFTMLG